MSSPIFVTVHKNDCFINCRCTNECVQAQMQIHTHTALDTVTNRLTPRHTVWVTTESSQPRGSKWSVSSSQTVLMICFDLSPVRRAVCPYLFIDFSHRDSLYPVVIIVYPLSTSWVFTPNMFIFSSQVKHKLVAITTEHLMGLPHPLSEMC